MTTARGTMGDIAPEMLSRNLENVSYKSDVFSYGMLLLEMVGGRKNIDVTADNTSPVYFPGWIYNHLDQGEELQIRIDEEGDTQIVKKKLAIIGLWCIQWFPADHPSMKLVVQMLEGEHNLSTPPNPFTCTGPTKTNASTSKRYLQQELTVISEIE
uniref:Protein kinase domain-containing protein n=2 Tax=Vitis vinifera TaxID=29760 RepID=F6HWH0_VITVI